MKYNSMALVLSGIILIILGLILRVISPIEPTTITLSRDDTVVVVCESGRVGQAEIDDGTVILYCVGGE